MEVSNVRDHVTHATISGNKAIDFGISDSPEFFHILSSTLYSDQPLAVVREVLCNAWDAHIEAGCVNKPIEVTLTDEELVIRDFGKGIAKALIGQVYGVYGGSTKKKNLLVTGGFGLGCKSPFAYTDHFEVTSWHDGQKTIYNMSKSSAEVNGRPGIIPIASFPSEETGIQVRIKLKNPNDRYRFEQLIKRIASNGEMSVKLNGDALNVLPFSQMKHGFMLTDHQLIEGSNSEILIRYGHVIYPVEKHDEYHAEYEAVEAFLETLPETGYAIVFQAKPNTISVTPSREALSMQDHTIKTVTGIFQKFVHYLESQLPPERINLLQESIVSTWMAMKPAALFEADKSLPGLSRKNFNRSRSSGDNILVDTHDIARAQMSWNYPDEPSFRFRDLLTRADSLIQANFKHTPLIKSFRQELIRLHRRHKLFNDTSTWLHRKVIAPLLRDLKEVGLNTDRLSVHTRHANNNGFRYGEMLFIKAKKMPPQVHEEYLPFLRNIVVLTHNRDDVEARVNAFPIMKNWLGKREDILCYTVPRSSPKQVEQARAFFTARGVELIDLTIYHPWEKAPVPVKAEAKEKPEPKAKGLPILSTLLNGGIRVDFLWLEDDARGIKRTETPKVIVKLPRKEERLHSFPNFSTEESQSICALWSDDIAVATTVNQLDKYQKTGAIELTKWVREQVSAEVLTNTRIHQAIACDVNRVDELRYEHELKDLFDIIWSVPDFQKEFGLANPLTETDRHYLRLWENIARTYHYQMAHFPEVKKTSDFVKKIEVDPEVKKLSKLLETRRNYVKALRLSSIRYTLLTEAKAKDSTKMKPVIDTTKQIVLLALKG